MAQSKSHSVTELLGNKIKPTNERFGLWFLLENLNNNNLITDIGNINYTKDERVSSGNELFAPITEPFCDNIMVVKITGLSDCENSVQDNSIRVKKQICGSFNLYLRGKFSNFVSARHGVKAKIPFRLNDENPSPMVKGLINDVIGRDALEDITRKYSNPIAIPYKIELADGKLSTLLEHLPTLLSELKKEDFYLMDLDITQDFTGIFNKTEMKDYLIENSDFCIQGQHATNSNVLVDNDHTVGVDCLTWMHSNARVKIYNKFICQITSPGVNKSIGNHIINFIHCPDARLRETFASSLAKEHGITRLEATIYNYNAFKEVSAGQIMLNPLQDCSTILNNCKLYFTNAPFYSVAISKMWSKLCDNLENSCCLVFNNILQYVYWGNKNTKKLSGLEITLPKCQKIREKMINYALSAFSFNFLPVNYIEIVEDKSNKDIVEIYHKCFIKAGETYFTQSKTLFSTISKDINIASTGLINTRNLVPQVLRKRSNATNKLSPFSLKEILPLTNYTVLSVRKRKLELEEIDLKRRKLDFAEKTRTIREEHEASLGKEQQILETRERLGSYFLRRWASLDNHGTYSVYAFTVNNKGTYSYVGVLAEKDGFKCVYYFKGLYKNVFIKAFNDRDGLKSDGFAILTINGLDIAFLPSEEPFITFTTNGVSSFNGHSFAKIEKIEGSTTTWQENIHDLPYQQKEVEVVNNVLMDEIKGKIKVRDCHRLEELCEGAELVVNALKEVEYRGKTRYILALEHIDTRYISNYWLEEELDNGNIDLNYKLKIKLDKLKVTPYKHKERVVFCV